MCVQFGCATSLIYFYHFKQFGRTLALLLFRLFDVYSALSLLLDVFNDSLREAPPAVLIIIGYSENGMKMRTL